jgi:hypothetical protein
METGLRIESVPPAEKRLKQEFPKLPLTLLMDGLYANGPVMEVCRKNKWEFMIVLKDKSPPFCMARSDR